MKNEKQRAQPVIGKDLRKILQVDPPVRKKTNEDIEEGTKSASSVTKKVDKAKIQDQQELRQNAKSRN